jgi:excisionase family DNA binding protein
MSLTADRLLTAEELAERWAVRKERVWRLTREGKLPVVNLGGRNKRYRLDAIEEFERTGGLA